MVGALPLGCSLGVRGVDDSAFWLGAKIPGCLFVLLLVESNKIFPNLIKNYYHLRDIICFNVVRQMGNSHLEIFDFSGKRMMSAHLKGKGVHHLGLLRKGDCATVVGLAVTTGPEQSAIRMRLLELGFAAGEKIRVVAESFPRRDPMAVRLGNTTFALRRHEAAMIHIERSDLKVA